MNGCVKLWVVLGLLLVFCPGVEAQMTVMLKSEKGYVGTTISGRVEAHGDLTTRSCVFYLEDHGDAGNGERYVALKDAYSNKYLVAEDDGSVYSNRDQRGGWETWTMIDNGNGTFAFRSDHGKYLVADEDHALRANRDGVGPWESFVVERARHLGCEDDPDYEEYSRDWETKDGQPVCGPALVAISTWACQSREGLEWVNQNPNTRPCPGDPTGVTIQPLCGGISAKGRRDCQVESSPVPFFAPPWQTRTFDQNPERLIVNQHVEFDGQKSLVVGRYRLPSAFTIDMDVGRIDSIERWRHLFELGAVEHEWNAPLRIETGQEGEVYIALGDGQASAEATFEQIWGRGSGAKLTFAYDYDRRAGTLYQDGNYVGTLVADVNPSAVDGTLVVGSHKGSERFFEGSINTIVLQHDGAHDAGGNARELNLRSGWLGFDGSRWLNVSYGGVDYKLPDSGNFTVKGEIKVNASKQWDHLIELGAVEYGWNAPLRIEIGNAGEWYVAVGDGSSFVDQVFQGSWSHNGDWVSFHFSFDGGSGTGSFYENGVHLGDMQVASFGGEGQLVLGSHKGTERFFSGEMRNLYIAEGASTP